MRMSPLLRQMIGNVVNGHHPVGQAEQDKENQPGYAVAVSAFPLSNEPEVEESQEETAWTGRSVLIRKVIEHFPFPASGQALMSDAASGCAASVWLRLK
jgi:hypothetical protein